jgi:hypothetical protein
MRYIVFFLLLSSSATTPAQDINVCYNYDCFVQAGVKFHRSDLVYINSFFNEADDPAAERFSIRLAVGAMSQIAGKQTPIRYDKGGNDDEENVDGRMDCIDHSRTTTEYLKFLEARGWLQFHRVLSPVHRAPLLLNDHWSARIEETGSGAQYVVDTWFLDNGEPAIIFTLEDWLRGAAPNG